MVKLVKVSKLGEPDEKFGQRYWAETDSTPVMFSSNSEFGDGDSISYEESTSKTSAKGTDYLQLKKVKKMQEDLPEPKSQQTVSTQAPGITYEQGDEIIRLLKKLTNEIHEEETVTDEEVNNEINMEDIPF